MTDEPGRRILVPVEASRTLRDTVAHAVSAVLEAGAPGQAVELHLVYVVVGRSIESLATSTEAPHAELLDQVRVWAESDLEDATAGADAELPEVRLETAAIATDRYLYGPTDYATEIAAYARTNGITRVLLDPEYEPVGSSALLRPLEAELAARGLDADEAPVDRPTRRRPFPPGRGVLQHLALFGAAFAFYQVLAWSAGPLDFATGLISAAVVAIALSRVSLTQLVPPSLAITRFVRFSLYVPYLLYQVAKANVTLAAVLLHPRLPIDPGVVRFRAAVWGGLPVTTLANSITLTPGTLTIDVGRQEFVVHTLTRGARTDLLDGGLERAVRFIFLGRAAARIPGPREREDREEDADDE